MGCAAMASSAPCLCDSSGVFGYIFFNVCN
jgi:hypothetical protein